MPAKKFIIPFATTGDKTAVPNTLQPDGSVSFTQGFGPDYELDKTVDPVNAKDVPRDQMNQLFFDVTDAVGEQQLYGFALWSLDRAPYPVNARVYHSDKLWRSTVINNSGEPGVTGWEDVSAQSPDFLNTTRMDVASAATVDLNGLAPNTRNIRITGTTTITGFTIAVGRLYFVSFNGALTLTNNAAITTNTGGNVTTFAGMTLAIRATSANTVEVLYVSRYATNAEAQAGARTDVAVTPANLAFVLASVIQSYTSPQQTITLAGLTTLTHGLTVAPRWHELRLVCVTADQGYSPGDEVIQNPGVSSVNGSTGFSLVTTPTQLLVRVSSGAPLLINKTSGAAVPIAVASWRFVLRAFA